ncbi:CBS domain-containing protein [Candidatus Woesearchaeota archaeon]|nr:CBS domain-containing protein [Candidatus Woesearchaeota archaeon]
MIGNENLTDAVVCKADDTVLEVSRILRDTRRRHLIVTDGTGKPMGIISTVDINNRVVSEEKEAKSTKASDIMTRNIQSVSTHQTYEEAFQTMANLGTNSIPVTRDGKLIGMLEFMQAFKLRTGERQ